jgi:hypothetical protein
VRQAVDLEGNWFLWPAPSFNEREFPGDDKHREAMATAREDWVKMEWVDAKGDWEVYDTSPKFVWDHPQWEEAEEFEPFLNRGLLPLFLHTGEEPFLKRVLGQKR